MASALGLTVAVICTIAATTKQEPQTASVDRAKAIAEFIVGKPLHLAPIDPAIPRSLNRRYHFDLQTPRPYTTPPISIILSESGQVVSFHFNNPDREAKPADTFTDADVRAETERLARFLNLDVSEGIQVTRDRSSVYVTGNRPTPGNPFPSTSLRLTFYGSAGDSMRIDVNSELRRPVHPDYLPAKYSPQFDTDEVLLRCLRIYKTWLNKTNQLISGDGKDGVVVFSSPTLSYKNPNKSLRFPGLEFLPFQSKEDDPYQGDWEFPYFQVWIELESTSRNAAKLERRSDRMFAGTSMHFHGKTGNLTTFFPSSVMGGRSHEVGPALPENGIPELIDGQLEGKPTKLVKVTVRPPLHLETALVISGRRGYIMFRTEELNVLAVRVQGSLHYYRIQ